MTSPIDKLCRKYGCELCIDPAPHYRSDAMGLLGAATGAQLCFPNKIAATSESNLVSITHELAHFLVKDGPETEVLRAQCALLAQLMLDPEVASEH